MPHEMEATPMRALDRIITHLNHHQGRAFCDDCPSKTLSIRPRQAAQQKTFKLAKAPDTILIAFPGVLRRVNAFRCPVVGGLKPSQPQNLLAEWPTTGPNSCAARHAIGPEAPRCLKRTTTIYRLPITYPTALNSSQPDMASTSFALPAAFASNRKGASA